MATKPTILGPEALQLPADTSANRPSPVQGMLRYNTDIGLAEVYTSAGWTAIDAPPAITSISGIINENVSTTLTVNGTNFKSGSYVQIEGAGVSNTPRILGTTYVNATQLTAVTNASLTSYVGGASFDVKVVNPSGLSGVLTSAGTIDRTLVWSTSAGSLGTLYGGASANISLSASDGDSQSVTFSITSGSLPSGLSMSSSGVITGTVPDTTATSSFTVTAITTTTGISVARAFSISTIKRLLAVNGTTYYNTGSTQTVTLSSAGTVYPITVYAAHSLTISMAGAQGGTVYGSGSAISGYGGYVQGTYSSIPAGTYYAVVGATTSSNTGGYPGGGGGVSQTNGGGGFSGFWSGTSDPLNTGNRSTYYLIAGGGAGHSSDLTAGAAGGSPGSTRGGDAGYPTGSAGNGNNGSMTIPGGGTQSAGGSAGLNVNGSTQGTSAGSAFYGGSAGDCGGSGQGGAGGGGWYGGGGGNAHCGQGGGAGGGGSSYYNSSYISSFTYSNGARDGNGYVTLAIG